MGTRRVFHVDLDAFFVAVERVLDPSLLGKPVVVGGEPGARGVVTCASYEARRYGLHAGMPLSRAQRLCPQAVFIRGQFAQYREASRSFMAILGRYTPLLEPLSIDEAFMDMTGFDGLYGPLPQVAESIRLRIQTEIGITASIGIASSKITAKVASDLCKPDGLLEVPPDGDADFLAPLAVEKLPGVGEKTAAVLRQLGITTVGQLAEAPLPTLLRQVGSWGRSLQKYARGLDTGPVSPSGPAKSISSETTFYQDTLDPEHLAATLQQLAERVGRRLRKEGKQASRVVLKLRYGDFQTVTRNRTIPTPVHLDEEIARVGTALLETALAQRNDPIRLLGIGVGQLAPRSAQLSMLDPSSGRGEELALAMDAIRERHGVAAISKGTTLTKHKGRDG